MVPNEREMGQTQAFAVLGAKHPGPRRRAVWSVRTIDGNGLVVSLWDHEFNGLTYEKLSMGDWTPDAYLQALENFKWAQHYCDSKVKIVRAFRNFRDTRSISARCWVPQLDLIMTIEDVNLHSGAFRLQQVKSDGATRS